MAGEKVTLRDGSVVLIRPVQAADAPLLADGFSRLSRASRELRFLASKPALSDAELRYLTDVDHHDHEALAALDPSDGRGLGVARYIRHAEDPTCAEFAVTVIDEWQGRGLGGILMGRLIRRAREEGLERFSALVSPGNPAVAELFRASGAAIRRTRADRDGVEYEITLPDGGAGAELNSLLRGCATAEIAVPATIRDALTTLVPPTLTP